ncbi:MAG: DUF3857 domain-containing protein [Bacteroidota bacterium]|nr:DUF3857 domain-containing protein [Bacteroidota bacterium]MDP4249541.1 DUF3857 domain-containing protein [Bacteroidota bacterium]
MKKFLLASLCFWTVMNSRAQSFAASQIPDSLKTNADVVIRLEEKVFEIKSPGHAVIRERHVYTILSEKADDYATYKTTYDKFISINYVNAVLYDASGRELKRFKKKDMQDHPIEGEGSFVSDDRYKIGSFYCHTYPYTVDFEEEDEKNGFMHIDDWFPQPSIQGSVEYSKYTVIAPSDYGVRFKMLNSKITPAITEKSNKKTYTWEIRNLPAIEEIPFSPELICYAPYLMVGPTDIDVEGYKGNMSSWNDFARFYGSLQKGRDMLPEEIRQKVHALTDAVNLPQEKVAVLYDYLQKNTHYVGIQLGIGGWQTFDAAYVAHNKYGDCKALSNFMVALLKEAGIKGYPVIIRGGRDHRDFEKDFTNDPFNHIICCVPLNKDTLWLECTSQYLPAGYLSDFTSNRYGLMVEDNGGELVHTPVYSLADNTQFRSLSARLDAEGTLSVVSNTSYKAACQDPINSFINFRSKEDQLRVLKSKFDLPTYDVTAFDYQQDYSKRLPVIQESMKLTVTNYAQVSGKRIFINPDILSRSSTKLLEDKNRQYDVEFDDEYIHVDSVQILIPEGYQTESKPADIALQNKFGRYSTHTEVGADRIVYYRKLEQYSGRFPGKEYGDVVKFYNQIYNADHSRIVLVRKN